MQFKEIEIKFDAEKIKREAFLEIIETLPIRKKMNVSSYDTYFVNNTGDFIRYRWTDDKGELTIKRKTIKANNNDRIEVNLPTAGGSEFPTIEAFCSLLGYKLNFEIFKTCSIFWVDKVVLVYYVVFDKELNELRRFIEIEADEDLEWESEEKAWAEVLKYEKIFEALDITPQNRLRKSLFEIFRKPLQLMVV
jgi:adenylate cyclase class IV